MGEYVNKYMTVVAPSDHKSKILVVRKIEILVVYWKIHGRNYGPGSIGTTREPSQPRKREESIVFWWEIADFFPGFVAENSRDGHGWLDSIPKRQSWILPPKHKNWKVNGADRFLGLITKSPRGDVFKWPKEKEIYIISEAEEVLAILTTWTTLPR